MTSKVLKDIFRSGSRTYFYASVFFPKHIKEDVFKLYAFVRKADDYVDSIPQNKEGFLAFKAQYQKALSGLACKDEIIQGFVSLSKEKGFDPDWADAFLRSMQTDLDKNSYSNIKELEEYIYGSAEVVGLMMAKILDLPGCSYEYAGHLGKAMQLINFIRDISEDILLGRTYLPQDEIKKFGLGGIDFCSASAAKGDFCRFIDFQIQRYESWRKKAEAGYKYIPKKYLIPVKTASDMYNWTAQTIKNNPFIVFKNKVKPSKLRIFSSVIYNYLMI